ncbi:MAG: oligosaccharide flippase family protein [Clostridia bacterium]
MINKIIKSLFTVTLISTITRLISFCFNVYLSRRLGAELLGLYQIAASVFMFFACFCASGIPISVSRKTAEYKALKNVAKQRQYLTSSLVLSVGLASILTLLIFCNQKYLFTIFSDDRCVKLFLCFTPALISSSVYCIIRSSFWGEKKFLIYSLTEFFEEITKIVMSFCFLSGVISYLSDEIAISLAFTIADYLTSFALIIFYFVKGGKLASPKQMLSVAKISFPITSIRLYSSFIHSFTAIILPLMLVKFGMSTMSATSAYGRMSGMVMPLLNAPCSICSALAIVIIPELVTAKALNQGEKLNASIHKSLMFCVSICCLFIVLFVSYGKELSAILYQDLIVGKYLMLSSIIVLPICIDQILVAIMNSLGYEYKTFLSNFIGGLFMLVSIVFSAKFIGIYALPFSMMIFHSVSLVINLLRFNKQLNLKNTSFKNVIILVLSSGVLAYIGNTVTKILNNFIPAFWSIVLQTFLLSSVFCAVLFMLNIVNKDVLKKFLTKTN